MFGKKNLKRKPTNSSPIRPRLVVGEGSVALEDDTRPDCELENLSVPTDYEKVDKKQKIQELDDESDDEYLEGEYYHFIGRHFHCLKELKISGLAKEAGVGDQNYFINEVEFYMKDKWNSFSPDLKAFLQEDSKAKIPAYDKHQLFQIVNVINLFKDIYSAEATRKISFLGRPQQLTIAAGYRDLIKSVKKMIEDGRNAVGGTQCGGSQVAC